MTQPGQVVFSKMEEVVYGKPAAETVAGLARRQGTVSATGSTVMAWEYLLFTARKRA